MIIYKTTNNVIQNNIYYQNAKWFMLHLRYNTVNVRAIVFLQGMKIIKYILGPLLLDDLLYTWSNYNSTAIYDSALSYCSVAIVRAIKFPHATHYSLIEYKYIKWWLELMCL